jgi:glyoxylase-like metal-dependent hydrolase (beta-lactamase superfamily II)
MVQQIDVNQAVELGGSSVGQAVSILSDVAYRRLGLVNVVYVDQQMSVNNSWVLIDAGVVGTTNPIVNGAEDLFGDGSRPAAIILTHGHFDHVGALSNLAERWDMPIYAHAEELRYLDGSESYPPPDPSVGGGLMSTLSRFYPRGPIDVSRWLQPLPPDGLIPELPGWQWIHTPGHTAGHVSFWRETDRTLVVGDAFITTAQESAYAVLTQQPEIHGPPMYYTTDWESAGTSVLRLAALEPEVVVTGHGAPMQGPAMRQALHELARRFDALAVPAHGRYVDSPQRPK